MVEVRLVCSVRRLHCCVLGLCSYQAPLLVFHRKRRPLRQCIRLDVASMRFCGSDSEEDDRLVNLIRRTPAGHAVYRCYVNPWFVREESGGTSFQNTRLVTALYLDMPSSFN